ncbi:hypothetical protein BU26DRAFT_600002 [Trematosphaeria pertusa]|uniref:Uncharacterized protein n=1 Tax=Trematosphaeria pertusa TaxID=390896 RepID=A0A6A6IUH0_9PLEO|nr:uncharacterized protein BU26DRAFT_600002 [Trematosphaeria pertusa]KAF2254205.1 hypothetical protein BU26DRAFT_600002 [Trematosphaeria pertusa]
MASMLSPCPPSMDSPENTSRTLLEPNLQVEFASDPPHREPASKSNPTASALTQRPFVTSTQDLSGLFSHFSDDSRREFQYASFAFVTEDHTVYYGRSPTRKVTPEIVNESLKQVPDEDVYPVDPYWAKGSSNPSALQL